LLIAAAIPLLPQILLNNRYVGTPNPFVMSSAYPSQIVWGMRSLKYATLVSPAESPFLVYANPLWDPGWSTPAVFARRSPAAYAATLGLHAFALVDQDALFTYLTNRRPWYRWPVGIANLAWLFLALLGAACAVAGSGPCRASADLRRAARLSASLCALLVLFY